MSEKTSRIILIIEAVLIVLPITGLALIASWMIFFDKYGMHGFHQLYSGYSKTLALLSLASILSGWRLFFSFLRGGVNRLQKIHFSWWLILLIGALILFGSFFGWLPSAYPVLSTMGEIEFILRIFSLASPLLIPLTHLALEKIMRKPTGEIAFCEQTKEL